MATFNQKHDMSNPIDPDVSLLNETSAVDASEHPQKDILPGDSTMTRAEKIVRHNEENLDEDGTARKRVKFDHNNDTDDDPNHSHTSYAAHKTTYVKGITPIKAEFRVDLSALNLVAHVDDDRREVEGRYNEELIAGRGGKKTKSGQNKHRGFGLSRDAIQLCKSRDHANEHDPIVCQFGDNCKNQHDIRLYVKSGKREDLETLGATCTLFDTTGACESGWRCRWASSHSRENISGEKPELIMLAKRPSASETVNVVNSDDKISLRKKRFPLPKSDQMIKHYEHSYGHGLEDPATRSDLKAAYVEPVLRPSEKRRIYYGPDTPILAPLTTQGNLPFRQLCVSLAAELTFSEMAMSTSLIAGEKSEWALLKAHDTEMYPPQGGLVNDIKFGAQIAGNKPWIAMKATEAITTLCPQIRVVDLNCGCPIDLVFKQGAGSALMEHPGKLEKILRGMNTVSGEVPVTVKIRTGVKDSTSTAHKLCERLIIGGTEAHERGEGPAGIAAITLHGRSRQQRYTRSANWEYIAECAATIKRCKEEFARVQDTVREPDARDLSSSIKSDGMPYFVGNGDIYSHVDYQEHVRDGAVDAGMVGRGALIKPWIFEEIQSGQYLDKTATERLGYIEQFCRNGLAHWGSDEIGVASTRRYLLEWLSFSCRYVPVGILEHLPPRLGDRPPAFRGRDDLETLLSSANYKDWLKISEMFLGKPLPGFHFVPKHKSNSYEIEAEG